MIPKELADVMGHLIGLITGNSSGVTQTQAPVLTRYSPTADRTLIYGGIPNANNVNLALDHGVFLEKSKTSINRAYGIDIDCLPNDSLIGYSDLKIKKESLIACLTRIANKNVTYDFFTRSDFAVSIEVFDRIFLSNRCQKFIENSTPDVIFVASLMIGHKYNNDKPYGNNLWAQMGNISLYVLNAKELEILMGIDFHVGPSLTGAALVETIPLERSPAVK